MRKRIVRSKTKFDKYYSKFFSDTPLYAIAVFLHPAYRADYGSRIWPDEAYKRAEWQLKHTWEKYRRENPSPVPYETLQDHTIPPQPDSFDFLRAEIQKEFTRPGSQDELENYLSEQSYGQSKLKIDPIQWWISPDQAKRWPQLSRFAVNILLIPAMSAKPEVIFSGGRRTIGWERTQLSVKTFEQIECEKDWIRSNVLKSVF